MTTHDALCSINARQDARRARHVAAILVAEPLRHRRLLAADAQKEQRPEADFNIEWQSNSKMAAESMKLALFVKLSADKYTTDYPGTLGPHMTNTDSRPFQDLVAAISLRENERGMNTGAGWNPHWHQPTDLYKTFSDKDFKLGLNAAHATLSAIAQLTGAKIVKK